MECCLVSVDVRSVDTRLMIVQIFPFGNVSAVTVSLGMTNGVLVDTVTVYGLIVQVKCIKLLINFNTGECAF